MKLLHQSYSTNGVRPSALYLLSTHDVKVEGGIVFLPLYMSGLLAS